MNPYEEALEWARENPGPRPTLEDYDEWYGTGEDDAE